MTEQASETQLIEAASAGAAAAVAAVADDQAEQERAQQVAESAEFATVAAEVAAESATMAVEASAEASGVAYQAAEQATVAAEIAYDARAEIERLRAEYDERANRGMEEMRVFMEEMNARFSQPATQEPTEVVVTTRDDARPDTPAEQSRDNPGSSGSTGSTRRHKFGRR